MLRRLRSARKSSSPEPKDEVEKPSVNEPKQPTVIKTKENVELSAADQSKTTPAARPVSSGTEAKTIIGKGIVVTGEITGSGDVDIRGTVVGTVLLKNNSAIVSRTGLAQAGITAKNVEIAGRVEGDVVAQELVIIRKDSVIAGNVSSARVSLEDGAQFKGSIDMSSGNANSSAASDQKRRAGGAAQGQQPAARPTQAPPGQSGSPQQPPGATPPAASANRPASSGTHNRT